jgi:hypothetical protein
MRMGNIGSMLQELEDLERVNYAYALSNKECAAKEISKWKSPLEV